MDRSSSIDHGMNGPGMNKLGLRIPCAEPQTVGKGKVSTRTAPENGVDESDEVDFCARRGVGPRKELAASRRVCEIGI